MNVVPEIEALRFLETASAFACFCRSWWDAESIDAVVWWEANGAYSRSVVTSGSQAQPSVLLHEAGTPVSRSEIESIISQFVKLGICELPCQEKRLIYTNFDDWFGVKTSAMREPYWVKICGGKHADPRAADLLDAVFARCPDVRTRTD